MSPDVKAAFTVEPEQALDYFRKKGLKPTFHWLDMFRQEHERAFTVAKLLDMELLLTVKEAVARRIAEGRPMQQFVDALTPTLQKAGWWGKQPTIGPKTKNLVDAQLGSPWRLKNIFRTNVQTAYAAGQWEHIEQTKTALPYLMYDAVDDHRTRDEHAKWDGTVLPVDDPWWATHFVPNGYGCRCGTIPLTERQAKARRISRRPRQTFRTWTNPRTGKTHRVEEGIDPGFDYHPGRQRAERLATLAVERVQALEPAVGAAAWASIKVEAVGALASGYRDWAARRPARGDYFAAGVLSPAAVDALASKGIALKTAAVIVRAASAKHVTRKHLADEHRYTLLEGGL